MNEQKQYWGAPPERFGMSNGPLCLEGRCSIALILIEHFGAVAAIQDGEDKTGRAQLRLQTPEELIERCFKLADLYMQEAERRNGVKSGEDVATAAEAVREQREQERYQKRV